MRLLPALILALLLPQDKGPKKLEWKLPKNKAAVYAFLEKGKPGPREFVILGSELTAASNRLVVDSYADLPFPFLFQLPADPVRSGMSPWEVSATFFADSNDATAFGLLGGGGSIRPVHAKGRFAVKKLEKKADDEIVTIDGAFTFFELRREFVNNQVNLVVTKNDVGSLATSALFSIPRGMVVKAGFQLKVKGQEREGDDGGVGGLGGLLPAGGRAAGGRGGVADRVFTLQEALELREEADLDPEKLGPRIAGAVKMAQEWLKKQQKPNGSWGTPGQGEGAVDLATTGLVLRALLAAGSPADDPAVVAGGKALSAPAPEDTWSLAQQVAALAAKGPAKDELDPLKRLAEELLRRRDARLGLWGTGGRNDTLNAYSTALAAEALSSESTGVKVADDVWKGLLDQLTLTWIEGTRDVELDLEFEKDATTIGTDPKRNLPCAWPADYSRRAPNDPLQMRAARRGSSLTHLSALKSLLVAAGQLTLDDKQKKSLDTALRKGLAQLQAEWTLRTVPPVEGSWSLQRPRYLSLLAQTLERAKVLRVAGSDWRMDGSFLLLREQGTDGAWTGGLDDPVQRTAHHLAFLGAALKR